MFLKEDLQSKSKWEQFYDNIAKCMTLLRKRSQSENKYPAFPGSPVTSRCMQQNCSHAIYNQSSSSMTIKVYVQAKHVLYF